MTPMDRMIPDTEALVQAGRVLAWNSGADCDVLEGLIRRVARKAQRAMVMRMLALPHNDDEDDSG